MKEIKCKTNINQIHSFLDSTKTNWRNTIYIRCNICRWEKEASCGDFLFAPNAKGLPLIVPVSDIEWLWGRHVDMTECLSVMSGVRFLDIFDLWIKGCIQDDIRCPLLQILEQCNRDTELEK